MIEPNFVRTSTPIPPNESRLTEASFQSNLICICFWFTRIQKPLYLRTNWSDLVYFLVATNPRFLQIFGSRLSRPLISHIFLVRSGPSWTVQPVLDRESLLIRQFENPTKDISMDIPSPVRVVPNKQKMKPFQYFVLCLFTSKSNLVNFLLQFIFDSNWLI